VVRTELLELQGMRTGKDFGSLNKLVFLLQTSTKRRQDSSEPLLVVRELSFQNQQSTG